MLQQREQVVMGSPSEPRHGRSSEQALPQHTQHQSRGRMLSPAAVDPFRPAPCSTDDGAYIGIGYSFDLPGVVSPAQQAFLCARAAVLRLQGAASSAHGGLAQQKQAQQQLDQQQRQQQAQVQQKVQTQDSLGPEVQQATRCSTGAQPAACCNIMPAPSQSRAPHPSVKALLFLNHAVARALEELEGSRAGSRQQLKCVRPAAGAHHISHGSSRPAEGTSNVGAEAQCETEFALKLMKAVPRALATAGLPSGCEAGDAECHARVADAAAGAASKRMCEVAEELAAIRDAAEAPMGVHNMVPYRIPSGADVNALCSVVARLRACESDVWMHAALAAEVASLQVCGSRGSGFAGVKKQRWPLLHVCGS